MPTILNKRLKENNMNRSIKFRVWKNDKFKTFPEEMVGNRCAHFCMSTEQDKFGVYCINSTDNVICQEFTGLKDKNGKEIYEGDIIKFEYQDEISIRKIVFRDGYFGLYRGENLRHAILEPYKNMCVIIGNIFENPELLNEN